MKSVPSGCYGESNGGGGLQRQEQYSPSISGDQYDQRILLDFAFSNGEFFYLICSTLALLGAVVLNIDIREKNFKTFPRPHPRHIKAKDLGNGARYQYISVSLGSSNVQPCLLPCFFCNPNR